MHLLAVLGTRPEAIKFAPVIAEARRRPGVRLTVVSTGQHRELLQPVLDFFGIAPDHALDLMRPDQTLAGLTARALEAIDAVLAAAAPDAVLVQGDTTTAMAGALAAYYRRIDVGHIEAGLRTGDPFAPFPEETNRRVIGQVARWHFAPTATAAAALAAEQLPPPGFAAARVVVTGNTVIDALFDARDRVRANPPVDEALAQIDAWRAAGPDRRVVLVTGHRRENFGEPFEQFCLGLRDIAAAHPAALLLYPVHLNPNVQRPVRAILSGCANIRLAAPMDYPAFVRAMDSADLVITDSGGVQEEAPALGVPVLVTREKTERPEAVAAGGVLLVGPSRERLFAEADRLLSTGDPRAVVPKGACPYGDGRAAGRILDVLLGRDVVPFA